MPKLPAFLATTLLACSALPTPALATDTPADWPESARAALETIRTGAEDSRSDSILLIHDGRVVLEANRDPDAAPIELMSVTKSVVSLAIGALVTDGVIPSVDEPVHTYFPEWKQGRKQSITLRMLLDHSSGLQNQARPAIEIYPAPDVVKLALAAELAFDPGTKASYNNKATNLLAGVIAKASGKPMDEYLTARLFAPMGIKAGPWFKDDAGNPHAMAGLPLNARDLAKLGQLVLDRGQWQGKTLVAPGYIETMLSASRMSPDFGLLWWRRPGYVRFHADAASLDLLREKGVDPAFVGKLEPLVGRSFGSEAALYGALAEVLGPDWGGIWYSTLIEPHGIGPWRPFHAEKGPVQAFEANGSLGQYLVIIPEARLIAVRQIVSRDEHREEDNYPGFTRDVLGLAHALVPEMLAGAR